MSARTPPLTLEGVLFFPVTPFDAVGEVNTDLLEEHIGRGMEHRPGGVFVACGTGEMASLEVNEHTRVVEAAVKTVAGEVPVIAGAGGSLPVATKMARRAAEVGADGILLLPPYLVRGPQAGLAAYVEAVASATGIPLIVYQRDNARFTPETVAALASDSRVVGFKDGVGDLDQLERIILAVAATGRDDFLFFNGLPTAEMTQSAYKGIGVDLYSSAVFSFAPQIAAAFFRSLYGGDGTLARRLLAGFYMPLVELRDLVPGYAVALVKAGVRLRGLEVGGVRPPLVDPAPDHLDSLRRIIDDGLAILEGEDGGGA